MFSIAKRNENDIKSLREFSMPTSNHKLPEDSALYQLNPPYRLRILAFHPQDKNNHYLLTTIDPVNIVYTTLSKEEFASQVPSVLHQHDYYEILFVLNGEIYQNIENQRHLYPEGSCCLLNKNVRHCEEHSTDYRVVFLELSEHLLSCIHSFFSLSFFEEDTVFLPEELNNFFRTVFYPDHSSYEKDYIDFIPLHDQKWRVEHVHQIFESIILESISPKTGSTLLIYQHLFHLFVALADVSAYTTAPVRIGTGVENKIFNQITQTMNAYNGRITRQKLETELNYSATYLNYISKKYTGLSILEYGMTICMKQVLHYLEETEMSISDIAIELGFSNRTQFYKKFVEFYSVTPAQYRKELKERRKDGKP